MKRKKTVTEKTLAANRRNAKRSTGPRTQRGKAFSRFNAVRTGLFARHVVIPVCDGDESKEEFARLLAAVWQEFHPEGILEDFCVMQIAECMWRFRRAIRAERGSARNAPVYKKPPSGWDLAESTGDRLSILENAQKEIKTTGTLSPEVYAAVLPLLTMLNPVEPETEESNGPPVPKINRRFLSSLKSTIQEERMCFRSLCDEGDEMADDYYAERALPPEPAMSKILRYETAAQKKLDWALERLLESQQRRGKAREQVSAQVSSRP